MQVKISHVRQIANANSNTYNELFFSLYAAFLKISLGKLNTAGLRVAPRNFRKSHSEQWMNYSVLSRISCLE